MRTRRLLLLVSACAVVTTASIFFVRNNKEQEETRKPVDEEQVEYEEYNQEEMELKMQEWTKEEALLHQKRLKKYALKPSSKVYKAPGASESFGSLKGSWYNKAPMNMPGAFKFAEMLDGTDTIYGVTHNHYTGEFNSKSYIFKGTIYNPKTGTKGDDFVRLTGHWPNKYRNLLVFKYNSKTRLVAGIENGPVYYSDNDGQTWTMATGLPSSMQWTIINREDNILYSTNGDGVYKSTNGGQSFTLVQSFGSGDATLYSPRYGSQPDAGKVYFAREGSFYELNAAKTAFTLKGSYGSSHSWKKFSIGGDSRKLYVTHNSDYWVSTNGGASWTQKYPKGNWYGDRSGDMSAGMQIAVSPENPDHVMGGYAQPVYSKDGLTTDNSTNSGWGSYQNGTSLGLDAYRNRIRFNYHPDFQAQHFFYNSTNDLFSVGCTDGGMYVSYKVWNDHPCDACGAYTNTDYANAHFVNINTLTTPCALIYRHNMFTGNKDPDHIVFSTQDQGTQDLIGGTSGDTINVYQSIGGDGPPLNSADGNWVWKWKRQGSQVWVPYELYDGSGNRRNIRTVKNAIEGQSSVTFTQSTNVGWVQAYIDRDEPSKRIWMLNKDLARAEVSGSNITGTTVAKGTGHQVCAFTQAAGNADIVYFLQEGKVYKSTNRGDSFGNGITTPFSKTSNKQNIGGGWVLPGNDNWILFAGPSANSVGAILSKDGGASWTDVTGNLPTGDDFQVGGMVGTPDGAYVFAGTDLGPYVFVVAEEKWYPMYGGEAAMFNTTAIEYIASEKIVRFGTWGSGVWDFVIDDNLPKITLANVAQEYNNCDSLKFNWTTANITGSGTVELLKNGSSVESWGVNDATVGSFSWYIQNSYTTGTDYQLKVTAGGVSKTSSTFTIAPQTSSYNSSNLTVDYVDSEHSASRLASFTIDGDNNSFWHTEWSPNTPGFPHEIIYKASSSEEFSAFSYLPRQDGSSNGRVANYEIYGSNDNKATWTLLKSGTLVDQAGAQTISFDQSMTCNYIKFKMLSEQSGAFYASMAEFGLYTKVTCQDVVTSSTLTTERNSLVVYPSPTEKGRLVTVQAASALLQVRVFDLQGKLVDHIERPTGNRQFINTGKLNAGIYLVKVKTINGLLSKKLIIK